MSICEMMIHWVVIALSTFLLVTPVKDCNGVDEEATCRKICEETLLKKQHVYQVEPLGTIGDRKRRTCACYTQRVIIVDNEDLKPEKE